ncbi:hypothetical protein HK097_006013, partial [Rhizophlyctis rosea]
GLYGACFIRVTTWWSNFRQRLWFGRHPVVEVLGVAVGTGLVAYLNHYTRIGNGELVGLLFGECHEQSDLDGLCRPSEFPAVARLLLATLFVKAALTVLTFGIKVPGGLFVPSMAVGACAGRLMGIGVMKLQEMYPHWRIFASCEKGADCIIPGVYAMVGAAGTVSGVTRMTVSLTIILFELTNSLLYVLPIMFTILVAKFTADAFGRAGLYDTAIKRSGHPYLDGKRLYGVGGRDVELEEVVDFVSGEEGVLEVGRRYGVEEVWGRLVEMRRQRDSGFPVLEGGYLVGFIGCTELQHAL